VIVHLVVAWCLASAPARDPQAKAGEAAFAEQRWDEASAAFDAAYRNTGDAAFLYARAQAERRAGRCKLAIVLYEQFVATAPGPEGRSAAEQYIAECRALLPAEPTEPDPIAAPEPIDDAPPMTTPAPRVRPWQRDPLAATLVALGGGALVAGAVLVPLAYRTARTADDARDDRAYAERFDQARAREIGGAIALSIGVALVIGGVTRWVVQARRAERPPPLTRRAAIAGSDRPASRSTGPLAREPRICGRLSGVCILVVVVIVTS